MEVLYLLHVVWYVCVRDRERGRERMCMQFSYQILKPMMLRRLKEDVEKSIASKEETIIEVWDLN